MYEGKIELLECETNTAEGAISKCKANVLFG